MLKLLTPFLFLISFSSFSSDETSNELTIYTYRSFADTEITTQIKKIFEKKFNAKINFKSFSDAQSIINRLKTEGNKTEADIVIGLNYNSLANSSVRALFQENKTNLAPLDLPILWQDKTFLPFDYGYLAFVYNKDKLTNVPSSLQNLVDSNIRVIIEDPRTSSPGKGFLLWMNSVFKEKTASNWKKLANNLTTTTKSWTEAYGLFLKGETDMILSYTTSPFYHKLKESKENYTFASFSEGHYLQIEVAAISVFSKNIKLSNDFMSFLLEKEFQFLIPENNWMYPAISTKNFTEEYNIPDIFKNESLKPKAIKNFNLNMIEKNYKDWENEWLNNI